MSRITLSIPDDFAFALRREARRRHTSVSAVAREALAERLGLNDAKREVPFAALGHSRDGRSARESDRVLAEVFEKRDRRGADGSRGR
jgi:Ribbon-helix-helix protein, copG family